ncbi:MAG: class I SAM-dependent methyltransferase [Gammaproteobacteria bacterium]|nr:class I SAM-dependent methyltransferase [Gammaproteobacteria bacterium]
MDIDEAEIQVLASIFKLEVNDSAVDRTSIEARGEGYWIFKEDWSEIFEKLIAKRLIEGDDQGYRLTAEGRPLGDIYSGERPDMYWYYYQKFYVDAYASPTHSRLCERIFGKDLCQDGQTDMNCLDHMLKLLNLDKGDQVLDLGCGAGVISKYIFDTTGASVTGIDYAASAIAEAKLRSATKQSHLSFMQADFNKMQLDSASYDVVVSLDTLYWVTDLEKTLSNLANALKPGGRMGIFMNHHIDESDSADQLAAQHSELWQALSNLGLSVDTFDYSKEIGEFWQRVYETARDLQNDLEAEGIGYIAASLIRESEEDYLPEINAGRVARYLYLVSC